MPRWIICMGVPLLAAACGKGAAADGGMADSTATPPPPAMAERAAVVPDSVPPARTDSAPRKAPARAAPDQPLGYDSAFGPSFTVDSTGKVTPIRKKPPEA